MINLKAKIRSIVNEVLDAFIDPELKELVRTKLKGTVLSYGSTDDAFKHKRNFVRVEFQ